MPAESVTVQFHSSHGNERGCAQRNELMDRQSRFLSGALRLPDPFAPSSLAAIVSSRGWLGRSPPSGPKPHFPITAAR